MVDIKCVAVSDENKANRIQHLLPPQGFGPEAKTRGGIIVVRADEQRGQL